MDLKGSVGFETGKKKSASDGERDTLLCCLDHPYPTGSNSHSVATLNPGLYLQFFHFAFSVLCYCSMCMIFLDFSFQEMVDQKPGSYLILSSSSLPISNPSQVLFL